MLYEALRVIAGPFFKFAIVNMKGPNKHLNGKKLTIKISYPPASKASREVANLTERKNPHTPVYDVKEFVCLSVCDKKDSKCSLKKFICANKNGSLDKKI